MMTADELVEVLKSRGCKPLTQHHTHEVRDAVHETVHLIQSGSKTYEREALHRALERKAARSGLHMNVTLVRFELQARAVEMLACKKFGIEYDIEHWVFTMWLETVKSMNLDMGGIEELRSAVITVSKQRETKALLDKVLAMKSTRRKISD